MTKQHPSDEMMPRNLNECVCVVLGGKIRCSWQPADKEIMKKE